MSVCIQQQQQHLAPVDSGVWLYQGKLPGKQAVGQRRCVLKLKIGSWLSAGVARCVKEK